MQTSIRIHMLYEQCRRTIEKTTAIIGSVQWVIAKLKLNQLKSLACLSITGATRTPPTLAMAVMMQLTTSWWIYKRSIFKDNETPQKVGIQQHLGYGVIRNRLWNQEASKTPFLPINSDCIHPLIISLLKILSQTSGKYQTLKGCRTLNFL